MGKKYAEVTPNHVIKTKEGEEIPMNETGKKQQEKKEGFFAKKKRQIRQWKAAHPKAAKAIGIGAAVLGAAGAFAVGYAVGGSENDLPALPGGDDDDLFLPEPDDNDTPIDEDFVDGVETEAEDSYESPVEETE